MRRAEEIRFLVLAANLEGRRQLSSALRGLGLTPSQAEVLRVLADYGPLTLRRLGELLVCESGTSPSRLVSRMVEAGLVDRRPGQADRREIRLSLTPASRRLAAEVAQIEEAMYAHLDSISDANTSAGVEFLRAFVDGTPAGRALQERRQPPP